MLKLQRPWGVENRDVLVSFDWSPSFWWAFTTEPGAAAHRLLPSCSVKQGYTDLLPWLPRCFLLFSPQSVVTRPSSPLAPHPDLDRLTIQSPPLATDLHPWFSGGNSKQEIFIYSMLSRHLFSRGYPSHNQPLKSIALSPSLSPRRVKLLLWGPLEPVHLFMYYFSNVRFLLLTPSDTLSLPLSSQAMKIKLPNLQEHK